MSLVELTRVGFQYPNSDRWIVRAVNVGVGPGDVVRVEGRNGSGKTTLLKLISGVLTATEGTVRVSDGARVAYMNQMAGDMLAPALTVWEHLSGLGMTKSGERKARGVALTDFGVGLDSRLDDFVGHLSGGQKQIVALLSVLRSGAAVLCLDEFLSALDPIAAKVALNIVRTAVARRQAAVVFVSHADVELECTQRLSVQAD
jgi:ABC-2 type transport system ATP-binding protein